MRAFTVKVKKMFAGNFSVPVEILFSLSCFLLTSSAINVHPRRDNAFNRLVKIRTAKIAGMSNGVIWWVANRLNEETILAIPPKTSAPVLISRPHPQWRYAPVLNEYSYHITEKKSLPEMEIPDEMAGTFNGAITSPDPFFIDVLASDLPTIETGFTEMMPSDHRLE